MTEETTRNPKIRPPALYKAAHSANRPTYVKRTPACQAACPSGHDVRGWLAIVRGQELPLGGLTWQEAAFRRMTEANPFPAIMGRVCPALCQTKCNRGSTDEHVGINAIEHYIGDHAIEQGFRFEPPTEETGKKIAVIGGGPAGLACAYQLRRRGHKPTVFEANEALGGMLRYGLSRHRCPRDIVDAEIQRILDMGVEVRLNTRVGTDVPVAEVESEFDAIFWGIGAQGSQPLPVPGGDAPNCVAGLTFLRAANTGQLKYLSGRVLVIGGGDTAMDCLRTAIREGAETVTCLYRRDEANMPGSEKEYRNAIEEGAVFLFNVTPKRIDLNDDGLVAGVDLLRTRLGEKGPDGRQSVEEIPGSEHCVSAEVVILALGFDLEGNGFLEQAGIETSRWGTIVVDPVTGRSSHEKIYAGGDCYRGADLVVTAAADGRRAALAIMDQLLGG